MAATADPTDAVPNVRSKRPMIIGLALALLGAAGGYYSVQAGLLAALAGSGESHAPVSGSEGGHATDPVALAFVPLDPLIISLPTAQGRSYLRFAAQLEVRPEDAADVSSIKPRIIDVLNGYLRAVDLADLEDPTALVRLRGQMLRRVQIVAGEGRIRDLLIMEFVLD